MNGAFNRRMTAIFFVFGAKMKCQDAPQTSRLSVCTEFFSLRSYSAQPPHQLPPSKDCLSGHAWLCSCVSVRFPVKPTSRDKGAAAGDGNRGVCGCIFFLLRKKRSDKMETGERIEGEGTKTQRNQGDSLPISLWSAAKCTDQSAGKTQSVRLFVPAALCYLTNPPI